MEMVGSVTSKHSYGTYALVGIKQQIIFRPKGVLYQSETSHIKIPDLQLNSFLNLMPISP